MANTHRQTRFEQHLIRMERLNAEVEKRKYKKMCRTFALKNKKSELKKEESTKGKSPQQLIYDYEDALRLKKMQCLNTWGKLNTDQWKKIVDEFIHSVIREREREITSLVMYWKDAEEWFQIIDKIVGPVEIKKTSIKTADLGAIFEFEVATKLRRLGWTVQLLGQTGD